MDVKEEHDSPGFEDDVSLSPTSPPPVKAEQEEDDDDKYEDTLDLDTAQSHAKVWMIRMPKFLLNRWQEMEKTGQELGKVRIWPQQQGSQGWKVRMVLNDTPETSDLPHNYDLRLVNQVVDNTYILKEQDLPRKRKLNSEDGPKANSQSSYGPSVEAANNAAAHYDKYAPIVRNVPKKTSLVGQAVHEVVVTPDFKDRNYANVLQSRKEMEIAQPERQVTLLNDTAGVGGAKYGATLRSQRSQWANSQRKRDIYKNGDGKAIRIPKSELLDKLFRLFEEYEYWTLKGLRERTRQPEVYLKEVLDTVAVLNKKGPYAMKYGLRSEFKQMKNAGASLESMVNSTGTEQEAPAASTDAMEDDDDDDDDEEMETVF